MPTSNCIGVWYPPKYKLNFRQAELPWWPCITANSFVNRLYPSNTVIHRSCPCSQSSPGKDYTPKMCWSNTSMSNANNHCANWPAVSINLKGCSSPPHPELNWGRQQLLFCNGINGKIGNGPVWELQKCDMWSTVIRAYRVKAVSA